MNSKERNRLREYQTMTEKEFDSGNNREMNEEEWMQINISSHEN